MTSATELLPCPFCGGNARLTTWTPTAASISCIMCGAHFNTYNKAEAIAAWNTRAYLNPDGLPAGLTISDDGNLLNWRGENYVRQGTLGNGTLTAEQVSKATYAHSIHADCADADWQAIADDLSAELGSGTCIVTHDFNCSNCGKQIGAVRNCEMYETCDGRQAWKSLDHEVCDIPNYCSNCGAKVVG